MAFNWSAVGDFLSGKSGTTTTTGGGSTTTTATNYGAIIIASVAIIGAVGTAVLIFEETKSAKS